ncbi:alpha/beta hydrolase [Phenylobacterium sp.]|uniref:alpha/beta fold hydrolase n=1 Tax=Phenylobacterium sp. TaxID=1871053 RepID=UPI0025FE01E3|nr:alpha/beta hydrolase [Phenylobacterium sp.]
MGATASMLWWPSAFCEALAACGFRVIRYDNRDTGRSSSGPVGHLTYSLDDLADDAVAVLDAHGVSRGHIVGMSLGGMIGQLVALAHPDRVETLSVIGSSAFDESDPDLPGIDEAFLVHFSGVSRLNWSDRGAVTDFMVEVARLSSGTGRRFDLEAARRRAEGEYDRAENIGSAFNHAMLSGGDHWAGRLSELAAPLLVIHGSADPVSPLAHGVRLAEKVRGARLVRLDGAGHELHPDDWPAIIEAIVDHCRHAADRRAVLDRP